MAHVAIVLGIVMVLFTLADTFITVLNYNQRGLLFNRFLAAQWVIIHALMQGTTKSTRRVVYRLMTGLTLVSGLSLWMGGIVGGFTLIYFGALSLGEMSVSEGAPGGFVGALYYSIGQFSTVGADGLSADATWVNVFSVVETTISILLLSMVITFLFKIFNSIECLRTLCACFPSRTSTVGPSLDPLEPFLPQENANSLERYLSGTRSALNSYFDSIASDHSAVYFYSGKDRFVMPFAVYMCAGTIEGLAFGLPPQHPASRLPELVRLTDSFIGNRSQMYRLFRWQMPAVVKPVSVVEFVRQAKSVEDVPLAERGMDFISRFVTLKQTMLAKAEASQRIDWTASYDQYADWLAFIVGTDDFIKRSTKLFDYRPELAPGMLHTGIPVEQFGWAE